MNTQHSARADTVRDLYLKLGEVELREAEENLDRYVELCLRIYERIRLDPVAYAEFKALTAPKPDPTMENERSKTS